MEVEGINNRLLNRSDPRFRYILAFFVIFIISAEMNVNYLFCLIVTAAMMVWHVLHNRYLRLDDTGKFFIIMLCVMLVNLRADSDSSLTFWLYWIMGLGFALCGNYETHRLDNNIRAISKGWIIIGVITVGIVLFSKINPSLYLNTIGDIVSNITRQYNLQNIRDGYSASICRGISYTCYFLVAAMSFVLCGNYKKIMKVAFTAVFIVTLIATGRRGEMLAGLFALLIYLFYSVDKSKKSTRKVQIILGIVAIAIVVYILWPKMSSLSIFDRYIRTLDRYQSNLDFTSGRFSLYEIAFNQFKKHPFFGVGWACFKNYVSIISVSNAHNIYLQLLCETGVFGTVFILAAYIALLAKTIRLLNEYSRWGISSNSRQLCLFSLMLQVFFLVTGLVDNPIYKPIIGMFYAMIIICVRYANAEIKSISNSLPHEI